MFLLIYKDCRSKEFNNYKDINEVCMATGKNHIPYKLFLNNCFTGMQAKLRLQEG